MLRKVEYEGLVKQLRVENLKVFILHDEMSLGKAAAQTMERILLRLSETQRIINVAFAAARSQNEFLEYLVKQSNIPWGNVQAFHIDEFLGLSIDAPQMLRNYLQHHLFSKCSFRKIFYIIDETTVNYSSDCLCERYEKLLVDNPLDIVCLGIGENGHIAFNEPNVADFFDMQWLRVVEIAEESRAQQVKDGLFSNLEDVPRSAVTLTVPALMSARYLICVVPGHNKAEAVKRALCGPLSTSCPASILRRHKRAWLFLDRGSGRDLLLQEEMPECRER